MTSVTLHEGDNRDHLRRLIAEGVRVHSAVMDPPYGLVSVTKRFGADGAAPAKFGSDGAYQRASAGFMGSRWDGTGIERDPEFWRLIWDILLPGGYVVAFSSSRTYHRMAVAIEDAGFITHPMLGWLFGQGFPKAHNAAMAIDKQLGTSGGFVPDGEPVKRMIPGAEQHATGDWTKTDERSYQPGKRVPGSPEAAQWDGWAYGAQALKPALEPIYVGQKPFSEKNGALNLLRWGVGALNIDGCRVATNGEVITNHARGAESAVSKGIYGDSSAQETHQTSGQTLGRHPANLLHDGSDDVVALFPSSAGQIAPVSTKPGVKTGRVYGKMNREGEASAGQRYTDAGSTNFAVLPGMRREPESSAARFFNAFPPDEPYPVFYQGKATKADRAGSRHPTVKPIALMQWLCRLVTPPGGTVLDPFAGSGTTAEAARHEGFDCILMEAEATYAADIRRRFDLARPANHYSSDFDDVLGGALTDEMEDVLG